MLLKKGGARSSPLFIEYSQYSLNTENFSFNCVNCRVADRTNIYERVI